MKYDRDNDAHLFEEEYTKGSLVSRRDAFKLLFVRYGLGINSFFTLIRYLMNSYIVLAIIAIIQMGILYAYNNDNTNQSFFAKLTLGGFPYSEPICKVVPFKVNHMHVECSGEDTILEVIDYGILPKASHPKMKKALNDPNFKKYFPRETDPFHGRCYLGNDFRNQSFYKEQEIFDCDRELQNNKDIGKYIKLSHNKKDFDFEIYKMLPKDHKCFSGNEESNLGHYKIFVQASCGTEGNLQNKTNLVGLALAILCIFGGYHFYIQMNLVYPKNIRITKANMDLRVATAGQYTIQLAIDRQQVEHFMDKFDRDSKDKGFATQFEECLLEPLQRIFEIEKKIKLRNK